MKKTILAAAVFTLLGSTIIFGQTTDNSKTKAQVTFCNIKSEESEITINYNDLGICDELTTVDKNLKIKSFVMSAPIPSKDDKGNESLLFQDQTNIGGKLSKENRAFLKRFIALKVKKILIENVIVLDGTTEKKLPGLIINLK